MACILPTFLWAVGQQESGGNYRAVNPGSGALGRWQVMPANVPEWTRESIGYSVSPQTFLDNDWIQNAVASHILGGYYRKFGAQGAAAMWYSGQPDPTQTYGDPPVYVYVNDVMALCSGGSVQPQGGGHVPSEIPLGGKDVDNQIRVVSRQLWFAGNNAYSGGASIGNVRQRYG